MENLKQKSSTVMTIHMTQKEEKEIYNIKNKREKKFKNKISLGEIIREAICDKLSTMNLNGKKLKKQDKKTNRIAIAINKKLYQKVRIAAQEEGVENVSVFVRDIIKNYYKIGDKK